MTTSTTTNHLPDKHSASLGLVEPTLQEILTQSEHSSTAWRGALTVEAYVRREDHLAQESLSGKSEQTYWALVDKSLDPKDRVVLAGCESLRKKALVWQNGKVSDVVAHGVASVFTPPHQRGHGYAARMMVELGKILRTWKSTPERPVLISVLYSDIGKHFYSKHGWHACPSSHIHIPPVLPSNNLPPLSDKVTLLYEKDLAALCARDESLLRSKLSSLPASKTAVALIPDIDTIEWHHSREDFLARELFNKTPSVKGAMTHDGKSQIWMIWTRTWYNDNLSQNKDNVMYILRLVVEDESLEEATESGTDAQIEAIESLLRVAQRQAGEWNIEHIELWNPHPRSVVAAKKIDPHVKEIHRDKDGIISLKWYGEETDQDVIWLESEKYGWC